MTPAHDPNDFATGKRHNLEFINVFDDNGLINDRGGQFKGEPRFKVKKFPSAYIPSLHSTSLLHLIHASWHPSFPVQARVSIVEFLKGKGLFRGTTDNPMRLGLCSRSKDVIEPLLKPQWWVSCKEMAEKSAQAVRDGTLEIVPKVRGR